MGRFTLAISHSPSCNPQLHGGVGGVEVSEFIKLSQLKPLSKMRSDKVAALIASASPLFVRFQAHQRKPCL